jgi:hypothetical protein
MKVTLSEEQKVAAWAQFYSIFEKTGLSSYYDMDKLKDELLSSPCGISEEMGTAYKGALIMHINMTIALAQRIAKMISGTFQINEESMLKACAIMHLSKRHLYIENDNEWEVKNRGLNFKFNKELEGCIKGGERSALEALNNGVNLTPIEFEAIKAFDNIDDNSANAFKSIITTIIKQANELAYAIEKEKYNKIINQK